MFNEQWLENITDNSYRSHGRVQSWDGLQFLYACFGFEHEPQSKPG